MDEAERRRLTAILGMLGSSNAGERDNAALAAEQFMRRSGLTWAELLDLPPLPPEAEPPPEPEPAQPPYFDRAFRTSALSLFVMFWVSIAAWAIWGDIHNALHR